ncbi:DUF4282 domain-containing protein [Photobacterium leiognathi]|uniref:DUF4282 domain-containing protein n=1 Tax=Photobacterium leiognathi TaxID=553611 RepID=UPI002981E692|nr:DUF4282 domain-containing protein [Photobacterium leiognathi]
MSTFRNTIFLDKMYSPKIIILVYWFSIVTSVISGLGMMYMSHGMDLYTVFKGVGTTIIGIIAARLFAEFAIIIFNINKNLQIVANQTKQQTELPENIKAG